MRLLSAFLALLGLPLGAAAQYAVNYEGSVLVISSSTKLGGSTPNTLPL